IFEPGRGRAALDLPSVDQRRQVAGDVVEDPLPPLLLALEALPALAHGASASGGFPAEHVRMPGNELRVDPARDVFEVPLVFFLEQEREEKDLEEEVAQLIEQLGVVALLGCVRDLVGFLDRVRHDRAGRLLAIPRTIPAQPLRELLKLEQRVGEGQIRSWSSASPSQEARSRPGTWSSSRSPSWCRSTTS